MIQKWLMFLLLLLMLGSVSSIGLLAQERPGLEVVVTQQAKLRDGPGVEWAILGYVDAGTVIRVDGRAPYEILWVRGITSDGRIGWVFGELISAPIEQLNALPQVWVDDPFMLTSPEQPAPIVNTPIVVATNIPNTAPRTYSVISGIGANTRRIFRRGQQLGNRANVFSKVGDSITDSRYFLFPIGWGTYNLREYSYLQPVVDFFSTESARDANNSFANPSLVAYGGFSTTGVLDPEVAWTEVCLPSESPIECEYRIVKPSIALIMLGTNDVSLVPVETYRANMERIVEISIERGIIPVLSLLPARDGYAEGVAVFNQTIRNIAKANGVPLWDYPSAMQNLDHQGLGDGVHPSFPVDDGTENFEQTVDFTPENLQYGYTVRNLTALQVLDAIWRQVIN